jgi:hypothetical protein
VSSSERFNGNPRKWMTAEEFLAELEAQRQARLNNPVKLTPMESRPVVRIYLLDRSRMFAPRIKLIVPEDEL